MAESKVRKEQELDIWAKLAQVSDDEKGNYRVEITRLSPEFHDETGERLAGFLREAQLADFSREYIPRHFGGGVYEVQVRERKTGMFFTQATLTYAGPAKRVAFIAHQESSPGEVVSSMPAAPPHFAKSESEIRREVLHELKEEERRREEAEERRLLREAILSLQNNGHNNGQKNGDLVELIQALAQAKDLLGAGGNGQGLDTFKLIDLLEKREKRGEERVKEFLDLYKQAGGDPDAFMEGKALDLLADFFKSSQNAKIAERAAASMSASSQPVVAQFTHIRDGIADSIDKHFGPVAAQASMLIRGSRSAEELLMGLDQVVGQIAEMGAEEVADEPEEEPGKDKPGNKPGSKDK